MPGKDRPHREQKKPKKGAKKETIASVITMPPAEVEVVRKVKKPKIEDF
jgi:hypothetical protein